MSKLPLASAKPIHLPALLHIFRMGKIMRGEFLIVSWGRICQVLSPKKFIGGPFLFLLDGHRPHHPNLNRRTATIQRVIRKLGLAI